MIKILDLLVLASQVGIGPLQLLLDPAHFFFAALPLGYIPTDPLHPEHAAIPIVKRGLQHLLKSMPAGARLVLQDVFESFTTQPDVLIGLGAFGGGGSGIEIVEGAPQNLFAREPDALAEVFIGESQ